MSKSDLSGYDRLECPWCDLLCSPTKVLKNGTVIYKHDCANGESDFRIDINGDIVE